MRGFKVVLVSIMLMLSGFLVVSCATKALDKAQKAQTDLAALEDQAATDASRAGDAVASNAHRQAAEAARARVVALEAQRAAAQAADNNSWQGGITSASGLANVLFPGAGALIGVIGTLITQRLTGSTFSNGQTSGATIATSAITNADTANSLQTPVVKTAINAELSTAPPHVTNAVNAAI